MNWFNRLPATVRGPAWLVMGGVSLILMAIDIRYLAPKFSVLEMIFIRYLITLAIMLPWAYRTGIAGLRTRRFPLHLFRNLIHYIGNLGWFFGVTLVTLADLSALQFTVPLFITVMAALILGEDVGRRRWSATCIGFIGVLIIVRPGYIPAELGTVAVMLSAFFYAASHVSTKVLSRTESPNLVLFYMAVVFVPVSLVPALFVWVTPGWQDAPPLLILGATGAFAHFCIIRSFSAADASLVTPFEFVRLPVSAAFGFVLFGETAEIWTWIGALVIFGATYYITWYETKVLKGNKAA
jgi:drug/metabolite transporter (DMT)-like permease